MVGSSAVAIRVAAPKDTFGDVDPEALSALVGAIYDCALSPERWPLVLADCAAFVGAFSASLIGKGRGASESGMYYHDQRVDPRYIASYFTTYISLDPSNGVHLMTPVEVPVSTGDVMDLDDFRATRFYREWVAPQGLVDSILVPLERSTNWAAMLALLLHQGSAPVEECKRRAALIVPHMRRAALIGKVVEQRSYEAACLGDALDGLAAGMFLIDADGRLMHANAAAEDMLRHGGVLVSSDGRLCGRTARVTAELQALFRAAAGGDVRLGTGGVTVPLGDGDEDRHVAHVLPLTSGTRRTAGTRYAAVAALFVHRATLDVPEPPEAIARAYGLTLSELRVLMAIVHVGGVPETAETLGIAETTVKTHLARVFGKTGVRRQADLVKLVAGFAGPLGRQGVSEVGRRAKDSHHTIG